MVSGLCLWRSRCSLTTLGPLEAHLQNILQFYMIITVSLSLCPGDKRTPILVGWLDPSLPYPPVHLGGKKNNNKKTYWVLCKSLSACAKAV